MDEQRSQGLAMFLGVRSICEGEQSAWRPHARFTDAYQEFRSAVALLRNVVAANECGPGDRPRRLAGVSRELALSVLAVAGVLTSYAVLRRYQTLKNSVNFNRDEFLHRSPEEIETAARMVLTEADCRRAEMAERGVTGPVLDRLRETIELHRALAASRNVDKWVDRQFERIEGLLRDRLDREIEVFKTDRPPFYLAYTEARIGRIAAPSPEQGLTSNR